jgi:hypothetical protein
MREHASDFDCDVHAARIAREVERAKLVAAQLRGLIPADVNIAELLDPEPTLAEALRPQPEVRPEPEVAEEAPVRLVRAAA